MVNRSWGTSIESKLIQYLRGIFQCDSLSVLFFILCVNPWSYLLNTLQGSHSGKNGNSTSMNQVLLLEQVTQFSNDTEMGFGE